MINLLALTVFCAAPLWHAAAQEKPESPIKVAKLTTPEKALKFEVTVPAPVGEVWTAFTTTSGLSTWLWKDVTVDLRKDGDWTVHFPGGSSGGGNIVDFTPQRQLVIRALCPEQFPTVRRERTRAVFDFQPVDGKTRVTLTQTGWKQGKEWDDAYEYLAAGNAQLLNQLLVRFTKGPVQWDKPAH
jgi:uncharacterized protein YndB with AHSA1/START domain